MTWSYPDQGERTAEWDETIKAKRFKGDGSLLTGITAGGGSGVVFPLIIASGDTDQTAVAFASVVFSSSSALLGNNTKFNWDNTNFRLGINTSGQLAHLHIKDSASTVNNYQIIAEGGQGGFGAGLSLRSFLVGGGDKEMVRIAADGEDAWNTTASTQDAGLSIWTASGGVLAQRIWLKANGHMGIGQDPSSNIFNAAENFNGTAQVSISNSGAGSLASARIKLNNDFQNGFMTLNGINVTASRYNDASTFIVEATGKSLNLVASSHAGQIQFWTSGAGINNMIIASGGFVGINQTDPPHRFSVSGSIHCSGANSAYRILGSGGVTGSFQDGLGGIVTVVGGIITNIAGI